MSFYTQRKPADEVVVIVYPNEPFEKPVEGVYEFFQLRRQSELSGDNAQARSYGITDARQKTDDWIRVREKAEPNEVLKNFCL